MRAQWSNRQEKGPISLTGISLKQFVRYLLCNSNFMLGDTVFRHVIGTAMVSDPAPFFANLFFFTRMKMLHLSTELWLFLFTFSALPIFELSL